MVLNDAHDKKKNLCCAWVDVRKAYDSLSHRFPLKLQKVLMKIIERWNILLMIPLEHLDVVTEPIYVKNGVLQGDPISADLYTLSKNPISWELRKNKGYMISKPVSSKITH
jgi:hypothetical protein